MELLYLYILFYLLFILFTKNKSKKVIFLCTLTMYLSSSIASVYIYDIMYKGYPIILEAIVFHIVMLFLLLFPLQGYDKYKYIKIPREDDKKLKIFSIIIISLCLFKMYFDIQNVNLNILLTDVQSLRNALVENTFRESNIIVRYLNFFADQYWGVALVLAFYYMRYYPHKKRLITLLLISSLGVIVSGLRVGAREYFIKYIYLFLILTYWYSSTIAAQWGKIIRRLFIVIGCCFVSFFLLITILRFGENSTYDSPIESLLSYLGQGYIHFSSYFIEFQDGVTGGALKFPVFVGKSVSNFNLSDEIYSKATLNAFSTTIGSWVFDVGIIITVIITILHNFIFRRIAKKKASIFNLIYIIWIYDFIFSCMFFYNETINGSRILSILLIVFFERISFNSSNKNSKRSQMTSC